MDNPQLFASDQHSSRPTRPKTKLDVWSVGRDNQRCPIVHGQTQQLLMATATTRSIGAHTCLGRLVIFCTAESDFQKFKKKWSPLAEFEKKLCYSVLQLYTKHIYLTKLCSQRKKYNFNKTSKPASTQTGPPNFYSSTCYSNDCRNLR